MTERMAYLGIGPCGCAHMATVDNPDHREHVQKDVAKVIADGGTVERVPVDEARKRLVFDCPHDPKFGYPPEAA